MVLMSSLPADTELWVIWLLLFGAAGFAFVFGYAAALSFLPNGRQASLASACVSSLIPAVIGYWIGGALGSDWGVWLSASLVFLAGVVPGFVLSIRSVAQIRIDVEDAPRVANFAMNNFAAIDINGDAEINRGDLENASALPHWTPVERAYLRHMLRNWSDIGHDIPPAPGTIVPTGMGIMPPTAGAAFIVIRTINIADLRTYPERLRDKWHRWL